MLTKKLFAILLTAVMSVPAWADITDGFIHGYWFEDTFADQMDTSNGSASNVSFATGFIGKASSFNASNSRIYLNNSYSTSFGIANGTSGAATILLWYNPSVLGSDKPVITNSNWWSGYNAGLVIDGSSGGSPQFNGGDGSTRFDIKDGNLKTQQNQWQFVAATVDLSTKTAQFYYGTKDGTFKTIGTKTGITISSLLSGYGWRIGSDWNGSGSNYFYGGLIDEVGVWNRVLSLAEIQSIYNAQVKGTSLADQLTFSDDVSSSQAGNWNATSTWGGQIPTTDATIEINHKVTSTGTLTVNGETTINAGGTLQSTSGSTIVGNGSGTDATVLNDGTLQTGQFIIGNGNGSKGTVTSNGSLQTGQIIIGNGSGANGALYINNSINCTGELDVGYQGSTGYIEINGGTNTFSAWFEVGYQDSAHGTVNITGGTNSFKNGMFVGENSSAHGTLLISGGTNTIYDRLRIGYKGGSTGIAYITGGTTTVLSNGSTATVDGGHNTMLVGYGQASGELYITGGELTVPSWFEIGWADKYGTTTGKVYISGGTQNFNGNTYVGESANGTGYLRISETADSRPTFNTRILYIGHSSASGTMDVWGGDINASDQIVVENTNSSKYAKLNVYGPKATIDGESNLIVNSASSLNYVLGSGGVTTINVKGTATLNGSLTLGGMGTYTSSDESFTLLKAGSITGNVPTSSGLWNVTQNGNELSASLNPAMKVADTPVLITDFGKLDFSDKQQGWVNISFPYSEYAYTLDLSISGLNEEIANELIELYTANTPLEGSALVEIVDNDSLLAMSAEGDTADPTYNYLGIRLEGKTTEYDINTFAWDFTSFNALTGASLTLTGMSATITEIPEPSTWALLILGTVCLMKVASCELRVARKRGRR